MMKVKPTETPPRNQYTEVEENSENREKSYVKHTEKQESAQNC